MINIIIPMAGAGKRFFDQGYKIHKPALPTIDRRSGNNYPMVVCAALDLPNISENGSNIIFIDRTFHKDDGIEDTIATHFPKAQFITVANITEGQACTCLLAKEKIDNEDELLIAGCDNGMIYNDSLFEREKKKADCLIFTYRHHEAVMDNPNAYGWIKTDSLGYVTDVSVKKPISKNPMEDHAIVATFWFRYGRIFVEMAEKMISEDDRINGEFYVDGVIRHVLQQGYTAKVFEIERYFGWGTPEAYEEYMQTITYWKRFLHDSRCLERK